MASDGESDQTVQVVAGNAIDIGRRRTENQDRLYCWTSGTAGLYVIADGMGGQRAGGVASEMAIQTLTADLQPIVQEVARGSENGAATQDILPANQHDDDSTTRLSAEEDDLEVVANSQGEHAVVAPLFTSLMDSVGAAIDKTNSSILRHARENPDTAGLGSTVTLAVVAGSLAIVANLGDSRTYLIRDGEIARLTQDHSLVATLIAMGYITDDEAYTHPQRNLIYRSLGSDTEAQPDISVQRLKPDDTLILCSDGLWDMVRDDAILSTVTDAPDPQSAAEHLVDLANDNGGDDNISVIVIRLIDEA